MKKTLLSLLSVFILTALVIVQTTNAQDNKSEWPGVTIKVLTDNEKVNVHEATFEPGAVADWHSHPQYTVYAKTDVKMQIEEKGKDPKIAELKAGEAMYSPAVTHKTSNVGKKAFTVVVTEIK
jgi:quercetin dioxygenase-like cupin family protein